MERKEHPVPVIEKGGEVLEFLDAVGNPFKPSGSVKYQLIDEDGSVLSEGTIDEDSNKISLSGVSSKTFKVIVDSHFIVEVKGAETPEEESEGPVEQIDELTIPPSTSDPDDDLDLPEDFDADQSVEPDSASDSDADAEGQSQDGDDSDDDSGDADKDAGKEDSSKETADDESGDDEQSDKAEDQETSDSDDAVDEKSDDSDSDEESNGESDG